MSLLTLPFLVFCVLVMLITKGFKHVVEFAAKKIAHIFPDKYEPWWVWFWKEVVLPGAPLAIGGLLAYFLPDYPYPDLFGQSDSSRTICGIMGGLVGGWIYPRFIYYYKKFAPKKVDEEAKKLDSPTEDEPTEG